MRHEHIIWFRCQQMIELCRVLLAAIISIFYKKCPIWLITERGTDARDNGYWFFVYLKKNHPDIKSYYIISKESSDRKRLADYTDSIIDYRSMQHYVMLWRANCLISTHIQGYFPFAGLGLWFKKVCPSYRRKTHISLKHGVTCNYTTFLDYKNTTLDLLIAATRPEYEYFKKKYLYPEDHLALTGFCRYDQLNHYKIKHQILVMPTWREWLYKSNDVLLSDYVRTYVDFLNDSNLHRLLAHQNLNLVFYPHHEMQPYLDVFLKKVHHENIIIANQHEYDVQQLLKESIILITDYSSVLFDFVYMKKNVIYYQFDKEYFYNYHYNAGWFDYNSLGSVVSTKNELLKCLNTILDNDCHIKSSYMQRIKEYFVYHDNNNCERVYSAIRKVLNSKSTIGTIVQ